MEEVNKTEEVYDQKESLVDDRKTFFDIAKEQYNELATYLSKNVFTFYNEGEEFRGNVEYKDDFNLKYFDILLQYSVLQLSLKEKDADQKIELIEGVARHGHLPELVSREIPNFDWTAFTQLDSEEVYKDLDLIYELIGNVIKEFATRMSTFKAWCSDPSAFNFIFEGTKNLLEIIISVNGNRHEIKDDEPCLILEILKLLK